MKIICLKGGLGNQMFEYCRYRILKDKGENVYLYYDNRRLKQHKNILVFDVFNLDMPKDYFWVNLLVWCIKILRKLHIAPYLYDDEQYGNKVMLIDDYCQDEAYIQEAQSYFNFKELLLNEESQYIKEKIQSEIFPISVHIRRGDYLLSENKNNFGICPINYYQEAIAYVNKNIPNATYFIFSDDIEWCKDNLSFAKAIYVDLPTDTPDFVSLYLMTKCKGHIIANSTFSFWGAFLSKKQSICIYPKKWFANKEWIIPKIFPKKWLSL